MTRITTGFDANGKQLMKVLGYYKTRTEAMKALADFNDNPYNISLNDVTLKEVLDRFMKNKERAVEQSSLKAYKVWYNYLKPLYDKKMKDIRTLELQNLINSLSYLST